MSFDNQAAIIIELTHCRPHFSSMNGEDRPLVADEAVEFEEDPVEVHDFKKVIPDRFRGIYKIF